MVALSEQRPGRADLVVVGGGLAGLTAAAKAAKAGKSVVLLEQAKTVGGRAATLVRDGVHFNLGLDGPRIRFCFVVSNPDKLTRVRLRSGPYHGERS
jgi:phytoene dehydrogenase-like protein